MNKLITNLTYPIKLFIIIYIVGFSHSFLLPFIMEMTAITLLVRYRSYLLIKIIALFFVVIEGVQLSSIFNTGFYIQPLTITNLGEARVVGVEIIASTILITLLYFALSFKSSQKPLKGLPLVCLLFSSVMAILLWKNTPIYKFSNSVYEAYNQYSSIYAINPSNAKYFKRESISSEKDSLPLSLHSKNQNIVVIFTEGLSSVVMSDNMTPNLIKLSRQSFNFLNYYNHTAATFRGIRGQLTSGYQFLGGFNPEHVGVGEVSATTVKRRFNGKLISIPNILATHNYTSYFIAPNSRQENLSQMISTLGFDDVYGNEDFNDATDIKLTDKQTYELLWEKINEPHDKPFFIGVYTVGTHIGMDSPDEKFGDGNNEYNNKFHNLDHQFGVFFEKFKNSKIADNTILVFTADHAAFPTPKFKETFNSESDVFVDKIPLMIYKKNAPTINFDVDGKNSLALAPTLLDILGVKNGGNYFLGCSLFDSHCSSVFENTTAIGSFIVNTKNSKMSIGEKTEITEKINRYYTISG
ncbi:LTA synthase family protein [Serratia proteamaculans]|uniref:LTA synthase family protein n=1 Tax=Serratia proteamaculans TaxID=28151 RepID=UPI0015767A05|nr:LTA synthase family protein [Serratia proteamaculans]NTX81867.1 LTA synthase family protein [Serratia proteamaculans]NTZ31100.1 LTA synthase family protein [Serratia proteamaculans]